MTPSQSRDQTTFLSQAQAEAIKEFDAVAAMIENILESPPIDHYSTMSFASFPLQLKGPRFGVKEYKDKKDQNVLQFSKDLLTKYQKYLEPILWREAFLLHLPNSIREVSLAADLGLYCYYRFGLRTKKQKDQFLQIWQTASPSIDYTFYRYYPTAGFEYFDNLVDGNFLKMAKEWFKPFIQVTTPISAETYTENLERWMFNYHRKLRPIEHKILCGLNDCLTCSQSELAEHLNLRQPTISQVIKRLAQQHLLRFIIYENYPKLGLQPITVKFTSNKAKITNSLMKMISKIRYSHSLQEFDHQLFASFLIPTERMTRFRQWLKQVTSSFNLVTAEIRFITERMHARNLHLYNTKTGEWSLEIESQLENFSRLVSEKLTSHLPSINSFKMAPNQIKRSVKIKQEDFIYMQRATEVFLITRNVKFIESHELREAGYKESEHMAYRRRVKFLEKNEVISPPLGIGLLNIGLNSVIFIDIRSHEEETRRILSACQIFPHISSKLFDDGTGVATLPVPSVIAVSLMTSLNELLMSIGVPAVTTMKPTWKAYGWMGPPIVDSLNYDFENNKWLWTKDTLPIPRN